MYYEDGSAVMLNKKMESIFTILSIVTWLLGCVGFTVFLVDLNEDLAKSPFALVAILLIFLSGILGAIVVWASLKQKYILRKKIAVFENALEHYTPAHEYVLFDSEGHTVFSSNLHLYPNKNEFIRKTMSRFTSSGDTNDFLHLVANGVKGHCLLKGGANGFSQKMSRWLVNVTPIEFSKPLGGTHVAALLTNITHYVEGFEGLQKQNTYLENFIDFAPFGIIYLSPSQHIVGMNGTCSSWLNHAKDRMIGSPITDVLDVQDPHFKAPKVVMLKRHKATPMRVLLVPSHVHGAWANALVIIKLDEQSVDLSNVSHDKSIAQGFTHATIPSLILDDKNLILSVNHSFIHLFSNEKKHIQEGDNFLDFIEASKRSDILKKINHARQSKVRIVPFDIPLSGLQSSPTAFVSVIHSNMLEEQRQYLVLQFIDTSEQKRLEQQFIQSQKMQAVGQLAGGIAHDFNNLLTAMIGFCDLLLQRYMPNDSSYMDIMQIKQNANRAANLVRQLLAFSRQQNLQPKVINITDTLAELSALLRRLIGARIELTMNHGRDIWPVMVDVSQLEQVIINLVVNARDAMEANPNGGVMIQTSNLQVQTAIQLEHEMIPEGDYVLIEVIDSGHGIEKGVLEHIFEPFFSTKEVGAGTGLGLSTVYGIVKQTGGFIAVNSVIDKGTAFKIYLPRHTGEETHYTQLPEPVATDLTGSETILLVEDEDAVRLFSARALRDKGYEVLEAENGDVALTLIGEGKKFDLLITDVVMPRMDGPTLCQKVREIFPTVKTIFISGYTEDTFRNNLGNNADIHFLQKPFTLKDLAQKVKDVLSH